MKKNIGHADRSIRLLAGNALILAAMFGAVSGAAASAVFWIGVFLLVTSLFSFCPFYALSGISTQKEAR